MITIENILLLVSIPFIIGLWFFPIPWKRATILYGWARNPLCWLNIVECPQTLLLFICCLHIFQFQNVSWPILDTQSIFVNLSAVLVVAGISFVSLIKGYCWRPYLLGILVSLILQVNQLFVIQGIYIGLLVIFSLGYEYGWNIVAQNGWQGALSKDEWNFSLLTGVSLVVYSQYLTSFLIFSGLVAAGKILLVLSYLYAILIIWRLYKSWFCAESQVPSFEFWFARAIHDAFPRLYKIPDIGINKPSSTQRI